MGEWPAHALRLDARAHLNLTLNATATNQVPWTQTNTTRNLIADLQLQQVQTLRTTHLAIGVFSLLTTVLTVLRIISDARRAAALQNSGQRHFLDALRNVHPAEVLPLALACGAVLQQCIFVGVQSTALNSVLSSQCRGLAQITYPAIFIFGFLTLVFGMETAARALKREKFEPRGKWNTTICISVVFILLIFAWLPTAAWPMPNRCFGSLIWFPMKYDLMSLVILCILVSILLILAATISIQLMRTTEVDVNERIAASRMCFYLLMAALIYILVIPVEIQSRRRNFMDALASSRVAEVALFASGMVISFWHLFLRTNAARMTIRPIEELRAPVKEKRPKIRFFGPSDLELTISGPLALQGGRLPIAEDRQGLIDVGPEKSRSDFDIGYFSRDVRSSSPGSSRSQTPIDPTKWPLPPYTDTKVPISADGDDTKLLPTRAQDIPRLPATVYDPSNSKADNGNVSKLALRRFTRRSSITNVAEEFDFLTKPPPLFADRQQRALSTDSTATVQIGLRFSLAPSTLGSAKFVPEPSNLSLPPLVRQETDSSGESLGLPIQMPSGAVTPDEIPIAMDFPTPPPRASQTSTANSQVEQQKVLPIAPRTEATAVRPLVSGLRMNPPSVIAASPQSATASVPATPAASAPVGPVLARSNSGASPSPSARIPLAAGTMARSPPRNGWI